MQKLLLAVVCFGAVFGEAQTLPTPPNQPATGPGGYNYLAPSAVQLGPFNYEPNSNAMATQFFIYEPSGSSLPPTLPVILFLHGSLANAEGGFPAGDSPTNYLYWLEHMAKKGYTVVFPYYDSYLPVSQYTPNIIQVWQAALALLESRTVGLIPPTIDGRGIQTVFVGHSMG